MQIINEAQRLAHPQARLIPMSLMNNYRFFNCELLDSFIPLMQPQTEDQLFDRLRDFAMLVGKKKQCLWLALAFSHPNLSKEKLAAIARPIGLTPGEHLNVIIILNRQDNLDYVLAQGGYPELVEQKANTLFGLASEYGCLGMLTYLELKIPDKLQEMIAANNFSAFSRAASMGHLGVLRYLETKAPNKLQEMIESEKFSAFIGAAINGHLEVLHY